MDVCEFLAEDDLIEIVPTFRYDRQLNLITGDFGPFRPSIPVKVPMWLAINLHRQNKCSIISPSWVNHLSSFQEAQEQETTRLLQSPDVHWKETLKLLEQEFGHSIQCSDLQERREAILKKSIHELFREARDKSTLFIGDITLDNATPAELILVKELISKGFKRLQELRKNVLLASNRKHYSN
ncbi:DNA replication complex GINS protein PSF2 [Sarcoptes scabiei]|uniref:DNA replication complex GINS protein PSF2 n=1 Tax=Sarcoptes scabiei TaxID=52283 RepID=A0A132A0L8_SARSC|nr:DNA replication complex GINS protein PSF2 [Sarcoptes scabiei]KPM04638.1 DNA replication complex GINS protein PSF2-like protein [Sarcoptes scabiei]